MPQHVPTLLAVPLLLLQVSPRPFLTLTPLAVPALSVDGGSQQLESQLLLQQMALTHARYRWWGGAGQVTACWGRARAVKGEGGHCVNA